METKVEKGDTKFQYQFWPKLLGQKVTVRLMPNQTPLTGTLIAFNLYELVLDTAKGEILIPKHSVAYVESANPKDPIRFGVR